MGIITLFLTLFGLILIFSRYNFIVYIVGLELILLGANVNFVFNSLNGLIAGGTMVSLSLLIIAAIETTIGLALIVRLHQRVSTIKIPLSAIKG
jgi:NADH-quinone oxidoreductase subunit K